MTSDRKPKSTTLCGLVHLVAASTLLMLSAGCGKAETGPKLYKVSGAVKYNGDDVQAGSIRITAEDQSHNAGGTIKDGKYEAMVTAGKKKVEITATRDIPGKFVEPNPGEKVPAREQYIPKKYNTNTTLTADITAANPSLDFILDK
jgi:hypothetical protein